MERNYGAEIDELKRQLAEMKIALAGMAGDRARGATGEISLDAPPAPGRAIHPMRNMHPDPRLSALMEGLCAKAEGDRNTGAITYLGVFASGGRQSNWIRNEVSTDDLLRLIEDSQAARVLAGIGSNERLRLLLALLKGPRTVAQLVEGCGYSSSGQVYHHLRPLLAADLVQEDERERGVYFVKPHRVQGVIMVLAGIGDLVDPHYTQGSWEGDDHAI